ncbi:hypothetical protein B0H16DRAFT_1611431 [Mycena metata]|uniref:G domain-containing protein n=1 Tax=Mycena metata TaxID=1033252 RepID=A0AAD7HDK6_9AGAR|nr:hypothetical protein B0H16DRAFT_1611431 [Mycena metata]
MSSTMLDPVAIRAKCHRFRALILGRANAGKTTVLKKVCNSTEDPEIHSPNGTKIELETVEGSASRGIHDIENQLIFKSHPGYIFHDSRGFESGSKEEADKVIEFIDSRGRGKRLAEQLHVIWYCMPTETTRPLLAAEEDFFFKSDVCGKVPVVVIFTKWDGLLTEALTAVIDESGDDDPSDEAVVQRADEMLEKNFMKKLGKADPGPAAYVRLKGPFKPSLWSPSHISQEICVNR